MANGELPSAIVDVRSTDPIPEIPDSVVHRWTHDEGSGSTLADSEGSQDGTITGPSYTTNSKQGSHALSYITDDYVNLGAIPFYSTFTVMGWVYFNTNDSRGTLIDIRTNQGVHIRGEGDGTVELLYYSGGYSIVANPSISTNQWYHFALAYDGSDAIAYQDGTEIGRVGEGPPESVGTSQDALGSKASLDSQFLDGRTDDVMIASEALSESQLQNIISDTT